MKIKLSTLIVCGLLFAATYAFSQSSGANSPVVRATGEQTKIKVLVVYYSTTGNTEKMANLIAEGVKKGGVEVTLKRVQDASVDELLDYDGRTVCATG